MRQGNHSGYRVALAVKNDATRNGLVSLLDAIPSFNLVGSFADPVSDVHRLANTRPDLAVIETDLATAAEANALRYLKEQLPPLKALLLSSRVDRAWVHTAMSCGVAGIVDEPHAPQRVIAALSELAVGKVVAPAKVVCWLWAESSDYWKAALTETASPLTPAERCVLSHLRLGLTNDEIAQRLMISTATVKTHLAHCFSKLHVRNRGEAIALLERDGARLELPDLYAGGGWVAIVLGEDRQGHLSRSHALVGTAKYANHAKGL